MLALVAGVNGRAARVVHRLAGTRRATPGGVVCAPAAGSRGTGGGRVGGGGWARAGGRAGGSAARGAGTAHRITL